MTRTLRQILALPQTDDEERQAEEHIRRVAAEIRATWDDDTRFRRQVALPPGAWLPPVIEFIGTVDDDDEGPDAEKSDGRG